MNENNMGTFPKHDIENKKKKDTELFLEFETV